MSPVNKKICLEIFKRSREFVFEAACYRGKAVGWSRFKEASFQDFARENGVTEDTKIIVYEKSRNVFDVQILRAGDSSFSMSKQTMNSIDRHNHLKKVGISSMSEQLAIEQKGDCFEKS